MDNGHNRDATDNEPVLLTEGPMIDRDQLASSLGWTLKPEGLCRDDACVIVPDRAAIERDGKIDALAVAELLGRPAVHDQPSDTVAIGTPRQIRARALNDLQAPDFVLPDLDGTDHALSDHRSKKRLLVAFSSW